MQKQKNYKMVIVLALVFFLSIGYAVVNSVSLSITGTVGAGSENLDVFFEGTTTVSDPTKGSATVTAGATTATFAATNMELNEEITYTYTIQNNETDVAADLNITTSGGSDYFTITKSSSNATIQPGETSIVTLVVKMVKTPIESADASTQFTVSIAATPVNAS